MEYLHTVQSLDLDFSRAVARHSADQCVIYKTVEGNPLYLGFYFPESHDSSHPKPALVLIHGGSWSSKKVFDDQPHWQGDYLGYLARFYADNGFVCVSIDYRLVKDMGQAPGYGLIDSYEDCCDAMDLLFGRAGEFGIDRDRVSLLGESAGGHLAGAVATFHYDRTYQFQRVFLINPITDLSDSEWTPYVPSESAHSHLRGLSFPERTSFLSPLSQVTNSTCPAVIIHGNADACVDIAHAKAFHRKMCALSRTCDLHILDQTNHAFLLPEYSKEQNACRLAISIICNYLNE